MSADEQILLLGDRDAAGRWVAFVRGQADRFAKDKAGRRLTKMLKIPNGWALIKLSNRGRTYIIKVEAAAASYEFFTSEGVYRAPLASPGQTEFVCGRGSHHVVRAGIQSRPLLELCGTCGTNPNAVPWPVADCDDVAAEAAMRTPTAWQNQRAWEYVWWPGNRGDTFLVSAAGSVSGYSNAGTLSRFNYTNGEIMLRFWADVGWDLRPGRYTGNATTPDAYGAPSLPAPQYWRRACTRTVAGRTFVVLTDDTGGFHFFEPALYPDDTVPLGEYVSVNPDYPAWCDDGLGLWTFNSDGSRGACCPYQKHVPAPTRDGEPVLKDTLRGFYRVEAIHEPVRNQPAFEDEPGLIEVAIDIAIGPDGSWAPSVTIVRAEQFGVSGRYAVYADYLIGDDRLPYPSDTLMLLTYDLWIEGGNYDVDGHGAGFYYPDDFAGIVRSALVIHALAGDWTEVERIPVRWDVKTKAIAAGAPSNYNVGGVALTGFADTITEVDILAFEYAAVVSHMNLRTLSWVTRHQAPVDPATTSAFYVADEIVAYRQSIETRGDAQAVAARPAWSTLGFARADPDKLELWSNGYHGAFEAHPFTGPCFHPAGHWSVCTPVADVGQAETPNYVDRVNFRVRGADTLTTHRALYNAAFGDDRDHDYYQFPADPDATNGVFRTFGIFRGK